MKNASMNKQLWIIIGQKPYLIQSLSLIACWDSRILILLFLKKLLLKYDLHLVFALSIEWGYNYLLEFLPKAAQFELFEYLKKIRFKHVSYSFTTSKPSHQYNLASIKMAIKVVFGTIKHMYNLILFSKIQNQKALKNCNWQHFTSMEAERFSCKTGITKETREWEQKWYQ